MLQIGLTKLIKHPSQQSRQLILAACVDCGKKRWTESRRGQVVHPRCGSCAMKEVGRGRSLKSFAKGTLEHPLVGDIRRSRELGYRRLNPYEKYIYFACPTCGKQFWTYLCHGKAATKHCRKCAGKIKIKPILRMADNPNWKGGRRNNGCGYIEIKIAHDDPLYGMVTPRRRYVLEHRYLLAQKLGRPLEKNEIVHHLNGIKTDNRLCNLAIVSPNGHKKDTRTKLYQKRIRELEAKLAQKRLV